MSKRKCVQVLTSLVDLESDVSSGKRRHTGNFYIFKRVEEQDTLLQSQQLPIEQPAPHAQGRDARGIPTVRTTAVGEEIANPLALPGKLPVVGSLQRDISAPNLVSVSQVDALTIRRPASAPRRFHLSRPATPSLPIDPTGSAQKRRRDDIAVFEERKKLRAQVTSSTGSGSEDGALTMDTTPARKKLKRPKITEAEREWRKTAWAQGKGHKVPKEKDPQVVNEIQAFAQEVKEHESQAASEIATAKAKPHVTPPRGPKARHKDRHSPEELCISNDEDEGAMDVDSDGDYVYDTYVRHLVPALEMHTHDSVGHLVIPEEDQELWVTYIEDGEEDKEFETDDEDSNGKLWPSLLSYSSRRSSLYLKIQSALS